MRENTKQVARSKHITYVGEVLIVAHDHGCRGYAEGITHRASGMKESLIGAVTGDDERKAAGASLDPMFIPFKLSCAFSGDAKQDRGRNQQEVNKKK